MKKEKRLVPELRFPEFEGEWEEKKLGEICLMTSSKRVYLEDYVSSGIPFYRGKEITELKNGKKPSDILYISEEKYNDFKTKYGVPEVGDILITAVGTLGNVWKINNTEKFYFKDGNLIWLRNIKPDSDFLEHLLQLSTKKLIRTSIGSTQRALTMVELRKITLNFPHLSEQQKIANFLTAIDTRLQRLAKKKEHLEQYKKGVMQKIFSQEIRFDIENEDGDLVEPPAWAEMRLGEIAIKKSSNIAANKIEENFGEYIIYGAAGILKRIDFYEEENDYISIVKDGAGVGRVFYCEGKSSVLGTMDIIKPKKDINTYYLYCLLEQINYRKYITGSTIPHIYFKDYRVEKVGVPSFKEQTKIANFLSAIDEKIELVAEQIEKTEVYKKGLLQRMFV